MSKIKEAIKTGKEYILSKIPGAVEIGIILGSGMTDLSSYLEQSIVIPYNEIPNFPGTKKNLKGELICALWKKKKVAIFVSRLHFYQGYSFEEVAYPVYMIKELGAHILISTNAAGGLNKSYNEGDIMLVKDQLNLLGGDPLFSIPHTERNPQFLDLSAAYDKDLIKKCHGAAALLKMSIREGVLAAVTGPCYETPAEARMLSILGADAVCMSTIPEIIMANYLKLRALGLSLITNKSSIHSSGIISHESVLKVAAQYQQKIYRLLTQLFAKI